MAITLKEALERHEDAVRMDEKKRLEFKQLKIADVVCEIDKEIALRINEIMQKPVSIYLPFDLAAYSVSDEVQALYPEFTLKFFMTSCSVSIKLADKDWDWKGYGIKDEPEPPKSFWERIKERYLC